MSQFEDQQHELLELAEVQHDLLATGEVELDAADRRYTNQVFIMDAQSPEIVIPLDRGHDRSIPVITFRGNCLNIPTDQLIGPVYLLRLSGGQMDILEKYGYKGIVEEI